MVFITRPAMAVYVSLLLSACGGGSSSSDSGTTPIQPTPTPSNIIANAKDYSVSELNTEATKLVDTRYSGLTTDATIDVVLAQKAFISLFDDSSSEIPEIGDIDFRGSVDANGALNTEFLCEYEGKVTYKGQLNSNFEGNISLSYDGCRQGYYENAITGSAAINITKVTETSSEITYYFDNLSWQAEKDAIKLTGYSNIVSMRNNAGDSSYRNKQHLLFTTNNIEQVLLEAELAYTYENEQSNIELTGDLFFREHGKIAIEIENMEYLTESFGNEVRFRLDANGVFDLSQAIRFCKEMEKFNIDYIEQPLPANNLEDLAELTYHTEIPIAVDESLTDFTSAEKIFNILI